MHIALETAYGERSFAEVAPGANVYQSFATRAASVGAGLVTVRASRPIDGRDVTSVVTEEHTGVSCGA